MLGCGMKQERRHLSVPAFSSGSGDSNPRPLGYEPNELPLLHPATGFRLLAIGSRRSVFSRPGRLPDAACPSVWRVGVSAAASPPVGSPPQYSPALRWVTTGFGMGPGGASTLSATGTPHPLSRRQGPSPAPRPRAGRCAPTLLPARPRALHRTSLDTLDTSRKSLCAREGRRCRDEVVRPPPGTGRPDAAPRHRNGNGLQ